MTSYLAEITLATLSKNYLALYSYWINLNSKNFKVKFSTAFTVSSSKCEKLLDVKINNKLNFDEYI